jgi:hypothetical protein
MRWLEHFTARKLSDGDGDGDGERLSLSSSRQLLHLIASWSGFFNGPARQEKSGGEASGSAAPHRNVGNSTFSSEHRPAIYVMTQLLKLQFRYRYIHFIRLKPNIKFTDWKKNEWLCRILHGKLRVRPGAYLRGVIVLQISWIEFNNWSLW